MRFCLSTRWLSRPLITVLPSPRRDQAIVDAQRLFGGCTYYSDTAPFFGSGGTIRTVCCSTRQDVLLLLGENAGREAIQSGRLPRLGVMRV